MTSIFGKARVLFLGNVHALLDRAIDANSIPVVEQYVRDLVEADEELGDSLAVAQGRLVQATNAVTSTQTEIKTTNSNIELILGDGDATNDRLAEPLEVRLIGLEKTLEAKTEAVVTQQQLVTGLTEAKQRLEGKLSEMQTTLENLRTMELNTSAKEDAAEKLQGAGRTVGRAGTINVDNVQQRIRDRSTVADARFQRALGGMADSVDVGVVAAQAKQRIAARRAAKDQQ